MTMEDIIPLAIVGIVVSLVVYKLYTFLRQLEGEDIGNGIGLVVVIALCIAFPPLLIIIPLWIIAANTSKE